MRTLRGASGESFGVSRSMTQGRCRQGLADLPGVAGDSGNRSRNHLLFVSLCSPTDWHRHLLFVLNTALLVH